MENIKYYNPKQNLERGKDSIHQVDIEVNGEVIGSAEINYFSKPLPIYQISELFIENIDMHGCGYATKIMEFIEKFLKEKHKPGILVDGIIEGSPASGMYARRGWKEIPNSKGVYVYNLPENIGLEIFNGYAMRYTDMMTRKGWEENNK